MKLKAFSNMLQKLRNIEYKLTKEFENSTGFSITRYEILIYLKDYKDSLQTDIAKHLELDPAAITRHLKILEEKGYVKRTRNKTNAREIKVTLTEFATNELAKCQYRKSEEEFTLPLNPEDVEDLMKTLEKVEDKLK